MEITKDNCVVCKSIESYLHLIFQRQTKPKKSSHLYFRGESKYHTYIIPSLYMDDDLATKSSEYYYRYLLSQSGCDDYDNSATLFRHISEFQHYGAKTRILDITSNPLIALYFAIEKYDGTKKSESCEPGYVYIYGSYPKISKHDSKAEQFDVGHTVAIKSALNLIPQETINDFMSVCESYENTAAWKKVRVWSFDSIKTLCTGNAKDPIKIDLDSYNRIREFMELLNQRAKSKEQLIYPFIIYEDLKKSHVVIPSKCSDRIKQQQGAFIFPRYVNTLDKELNEIQKEIDESISSLLTEITTPSSKKVSVIKIPGKIKKQMKEELAQIGITEGFVYPEIEHRSNTLLSNRL